MSVTSTSPPLPYLAIRIRSSLHFAPFQDDLILNHSSGFNSILIPVVENRLSCPPDMIHSRTTE